MAKKLWTFQKYAIEKFKDKSFFGLLFDMGIGQNTHCNENCGRERKFPN